MDYKTYNQLWYESLYEGEEHALKLGITKDRLELYQSFVFNHYYDALLKMFSRIDYFLDLDWEEITNKYLEHTKATAWDLNDFCLNFPSFFRNTYSDLEEYFYELLDYEIAEFFVYKDFKPQSFESPIINPCHKLLVLNYDIASWIKEVEQTDDQILRPKAESHALVIARNLDTNCPVFTKLTPLAIAIYNELNERPYNTQEALLEHILNKYQVPSESTSLVVETYHSLKNQSIIL